MQRLCHRLQHTSFFGAVRSFLRKLKDLNHYLRRNKALKLLLQAVGQTESSNNDEKCSVGAVKPVQRKESTSGFHKGYFPR